MVSPSELAELEARLNSFAAPDRARALAEVTRRMEGSLPPPAEVVNLHCHTFFSFNAYGYSPTGLAWLARRRGFKALGIVDFDVFDGVDEFLTACETVGVRGSAGLETRVFVPEFATREINSPGEPGVYYYMGIGLTSSQAAAAVAPILAGMRHRAEQRNREMLDRLNRHVAPVAVDYDRDVLPLTPGGNATERHMLVAFTQAAARQFADPAPFWADKLGLALDQVTAQIGDAPVFQNLVRSRLMKRGGVGYVQPSPQSFPVVEDVNRLMVACGALPCAAWLDGMSAGEQVIEELLHLLIGKGAVALNIVPDRNWNIPDPEVRRTKVQHLYRIVKLAQALDLPLNIGTEMNSHGQKLVDDFDAPELAPLRPAFLAGADFVYGHTRLQRTLALGYQSDWAKAHLPTRRERNAFYTDVGRRTPPGSVGTACLESLSAALSPAEMLSRLTCPA